MTDSKSGAVQLRAELEELKRQIEIRDIALNATKIMIRITDADGTYLYANDPKAVIGYTAREREGRSAFELIHPEDRDRVLNLFLGYRSQPDFQESTPFEHRVRHKCGHYICVRAIGAAVKRGESPPWGVITMWDVSENKELEDQLHALAERLHTIREEERTCVSLEVHNEFGQALTGLKLELATFFKQLSPGNSQTTSKARELMASIDQTIQLVRRISTDLRPPILDDFGLKDAIEWQAEDFERKTGIKARLGSALPETIEIDKEKGVSIFRIFQEALTNVARHAEASEVSINLDHREGFFSMRIRDNGRGITDDEIKSRSSLGIMGMRERAFSLRGLFNILSAQEGGTLVEFSIPAAQDGFE
jgi:PAS domain S-box-containing protein